MPTSSFAVPLPYSWPKHAKAATLHIISLAHFALTQVRGWAANSPIHRVRLTAERDQLNSEVAMVREEIRIKDARMATLAPQRRPHYPPSERMAILQLMAARGWSKAQTGRRFLVTDETVAAWNGRIEEDGPRALVDDHANPCQLPLLRALTESQALHTPHGLLRLTPFIVHSCSFPGISRRSHTPGLPPCSTWYPGRNRAGPRTRRRPRSRGDRGGP